MEHNTNRAEIVVQNVAGCGRFQAVLIGLVFCLPRVSVYFSMLFMAFGNYNSGWRCLDNISFSQGFNETLSTKNLVGENRTEVYTLASCDAYKSCNRVEFDPSTWTVVMEWGLICDRSWIASLITSIQMAGVLVGSYVAGQLGDSYGRKTILYGSLFMGAVFNLIAMFSVSWQMYAAIRFLIGVSVACTISLYFLLTSEYVPMKWRAVISPLPVFHLGGLIFALTAMAVRDWRYLQLIAAFWCFLAFMPFFVIPESLRWLEAKNKTTEFMRVANKIAKLNNKNMMPLRDTSMLTSKADKGATTQKKHYTLLDLFKPGYKMYTVLLSFTYSSLSLTFYAISLGAKNLSGNFFANLILLNAIEIPMAIVPMVAPTVMGRKKGGYVFLGIATVSLFTSTVFLLYASEDMKTTGTLVLTLISKAFTMATWYALKIHTVEIYPTVVRALIVGWASVMARIGGIAAPFVISKVPETMYISYAVMTAVLLVSCFAIVCLPETKGKPMKQTFEETKDRGIETIDVTIDA